MVEGEILLKVKGLLTWQLTISQALCMAWGRVMNSKEMVSPNGTQPGDETVIEQLIQCIVMPVSRMAPKTLPVC